MYMFIRTWCWPGTISAGPPALAVIERRDDVMLLEGADLVDRRLPQLERPIGPSSTPNQP